MCLLGHKRYQQRGGSRKAVLGHKHNAIGPARVAVSGEVDNDESNERPDTIADCPEAGKKSSECEGCDLLRWLLVSKSRPEYAGSSAHLPNICHHHTMDGAKSKAVQELATEEESVRGCGDLHADCGKRDDQGDDERVLSAYPVGDLRRAENADDRALHKRSTD